MRSKRFTHTELRIDGGSTLALRYGALLVAAPDGAISLDWECVATPVITGSLDQGTYRLDAVTLEGRTIGGDAVLVRSVRGTHVLRGAGPLHGVRPDELHE